MATDTQKIMEKLDSIKEELNYIKEHIVVVDGDCLLTPEEEKRLDESLQEYREGKTVRFEDFNKKRAIRNV